MPPALSVHSVSNNTFPPTAHLVRGATLATIAYAIFIASDPFLAYELSWEGVNYSRQDSQGTRGTITFGGDGLVGVFLDDNSPRAPWHATNPYSLETVLAGMPPDVRAVADTGALQYLWDDQWTSTPVATTAFWSGGDHLTAAQPWPDVLEHGGHLVAKECLAPLEGLEAWRDDCEFSPAQSLLMRSLLERKMARTEGVIVLTDDERRVLTAAGQDGLADSRAMLAAVGIVLP